MPHQSTRERLLNLVKTAAAGAAAEHAGKGIGGRALNHLDKLIGAGLMAGAGALGHKYVMPHLVAKPSMLDRVTNAMGTAAGYGLGGLALGAGVYGAGKAYDGLTEGHVKEKHFKNMLAENPMLKHEDPAVVRRSYNTLFHFNKDMATDPTTAGAFVRRAVAFKDEGIQSNDIKTLAEIRKNLADAGGKGTSFMDRASKLHSFSDKDS